MIRVCSHPTFPSRSTASTSQVGQERGTICKAPDASPDLFFGMMLERTRSEEYCSIPICIMQMAFFMRLTGHDRPSPPRLVAKHDYYRAQDPH